MKKNWNSVCLVVIGVFLISGCACTRNNVEQVSERSIAEQEYPDGILLGGFSPIDTQSEHIITLFNWAKEQLEEQKISLLGEVPLEAYSQIVAGIKYRLITLWEHEGIPQGEPLMVVLFTSLSGETELLEVVLP